MTILFNRPTEKTKDTIKAALLFVMIFGVFLGVIFAISWGATQIFGAPLTPEERLAQKQAHEQSIRDSLPPDCTLKYFNDYRSIAHMVVVICDKHSSTSTTFQIWRGKYYEHDVTVEIR